MAAGTKRYAEVAHLHNRLQVELAEVFAKMRVAEDALSDLKDGVALAWLGEGGENDEYEYFAETTTRLIENARDSLSAARALTTLWKEEVTKWFRV